MSAHRSIRSLAIEAAVIVGSILLAFAVDAGWDRYQQGLDDARLLDRLEAELTGFRERLLVTAARRTSETITAIELLADQAHSRREIPLDSLEWAVAAVDDSWQLGAATPVFDLLTSDGGYARVDDEELSEALSEMATTLELVRRFESLSDAFVEERLNPWLAANVELWGPTERWADLPSGLGGSGFSFDPEVLRSRELANLLLQHREALNLVVIFRESFGRAVEDALTALEAARE